VITLDRNKLEELSLEISNTHGISQEQAASVISLAMKMHECIKESFETILRSIKNFIVQHWVSLKETIARLEERRSHREEWTIIWDTRKNSQVTSNKPKFMIRKII